METGTKKLILALVIGIVVLGINYGVGMLGLPNLFTYLPAISLVAGGLLALGIIIPILKNISQSAFQKAGLDKVGELAKAGESIKLRRRFRKGYLTRLRNKANARFDSYL